MVETLGIILFIVLTIFFVAIMGVLICVLFKVAKEIIKDF